jgi:AGCS family alanine or glycine:cation symporter
MWNPFLSLFYIEMGILFLVLTRAVAWRKGIRNFLSTWKRDANDEPGIISHRKAFLASLAATVGVGNLAGVGTAIHLGGPGALFWMGVSGALGMSFRMVSTYMSIKHQPPNPSDRVFATPMSYLNKHLTRPWLWLSTALAGLILIKGQIVANVIQSNSVNHAIQKDLHFSTVPVACFLAIAVGLVTIGGMKRIVSVSALFAPWMILAYVCAGGYILVSNPMGTLETIRSVMRYAFTPYAATGGITGYAVVQAMQFGVSRGVFSHASGIGVAPFLQGANRDHPTRAAFMAAFTPFVDTVIICTVTGLVVLQDNHWLEFTGGYLTTHAFYNSLGAGGYALVVGCLTVFAFTTIIGWAYCSEKCFLYLGGKNLRIYRWVFIAITFSGPFLPVPFVWSMADILIGLMLVVHLLPLTYILVRQIRATTRDLEGVAAKPEQHEGVLKP